MVKKGSNIELNCTVESGDRVHHSLAVFWYLDDTVIDWMGQTGVGDGVQVPPFFSLYLLTMNDFKVVEKRGKMLESILRWEKNIVNSSFNPFSSLKDIKCETWAWWKVHMWTNNWHSRLRHGPCHCRWFFYKITNN